MQHAFLLSRQMLAKQTGTKQIIMVTDGEPTAHIDRSGNPYFDYPPTRETVENFKEVMACLGMHTNQYLHLDPEPALGRFIDGYRNEWWKSVLHEWIISVILLVDFVEHRRRSFCPSLKQEKVH